MNSLTKAAQFKILENPIGIFAPLVSPCFCFEKRIGAMGQRSFSLSRSFCKRFFFPCNNVFGLFWQDRVHHRNFLRQPVSFLFTPPCFPVILQIHTSSEDF